jgi:hypothetical protein
MNSKYRSKLLGVSVMRNNFIYEITENVMSALIPTGIPQYFAKFMEKVILRGRPEISKEIKKFSLEDLKFCFVIYLMACSASLGAFLIEILVFNVRNFVGILGLRKLMNNLRIGGM